jgi:hypothetical protein
MGKRSRPTAGGGILHETPKIPQTSSRVTAPAIAKVFLFALRPKNFGRAVSRLRN